jgi:hypothetical protein
MDDTREAVSVQELLETKSRNVHARRKSMVSGIAVARRCSAAGKTLQETVDAAMSTVRLVGGAEVTAKDLTQISAESQKIAQNELNRILLGEHTY